MKALLLVHVAAAKVAIAEVEQAIEESGSAGHFNESQIEKLEQKLAEAAHVVTDELGKAFAKVESYFGKAPVDGHPLLVEPPEPPDPPAPADPPPAE